MSLHNATHSLVPSERPPAEIIVTHEHRVPHLPEGISLDVGAVYQHWIAAGLAAMRMAEARVIGSASKMQEAAQEISERAEAALACSKRIERSLARHRRRNPLAGVR